MTACALCRGIAFYLGQLGRRIHWRCAGCGHTFSTLATEEADDE